MTAPWTVPASGAQFPFGPYILFLNPLSLFLVPCFSFSLAPSRVHPVTFAHIQGVNVFENIWRIDRGHRDKRKNFRRAKISFEIFLCLLNALMGM